MNRAPLIVSSSVVLGALLLSGRPSADSEMRAVLNRDRLGWSTEIVYEGTLDLEAHFRRPHETRRYLSRQRYMTDGRGVVRFEWTTWQAGDSVIGPPESDLVLADRVFHRDSPTGAWRSLVGTRAEVARLRAESGLPEILARDSTLRGLAVHRDGTRVTSIELPRAHPRLGDVRNTIQYMPGGDSKTSPMLRIALFERDDQWTLESHRTSMRSGVSLPDSLFAVPAVFDPPPTVVDTFGAPAVLTKLADGVWSVDMEDIDSRSLVVEFGDHLAVIEAAVGSANGERIVDTIKAHWPNLPIRYALASHYHPHYMGGLRAFMAEGATLITTPGNAAFVRGIADYEFTLEPDRLARHPRPVRVLPFQKRMELSDVTNRLVAIDIGARSDHTDEFVVFWLPRQGMVFETEQGWITVDGTLRASRRAEGFLKTLDEEGVVATRFVQSWPMRGNRAEVSRAELDSLVAERRRP